MLIRTVPAAGSGRGGRPPGLRPEGRVVGPVEPARTLCGRTCASARTRPTAAGRCQAALAETAGDGSLRPGGSRRAGASRDRDDREPGTGPVVPGGRSAACRRSRERRGRRTGRAIPGPSSRCSPGRGDFLVAVPGAGGEGDPGAQHQPLRAGAPRDDLQQLPLPLDCHRTGTAGGPGSALRPLSPGVIVIVWTRECNQKQGRPRNRPACRGNRGHPGRRATLAGMPVPSKAPEGTGRGNRRSHASLTHAPPGCRRSPSAGGLIRLHGRLGRKATTMTSGSRCAASSTSATTTGLRDLRPRHRNLRRRDPEQRPVHGTRTTHTTPPPSSTSPNTNSNQQGRQQPGRDY